jgi:hypothetical protein
MKAKFKRKNYYLDENKIRRVRAILGRKTETEAINAALNLVVFRREILKSLQKVAAEAVWKRSCSRKASDRYRLVHDLIQSGTTLQLFVSFTRKRHQGFTSALS